MYSAWNVPSLFVANALLGWANPEDVQEEFNQLVEYNTLIHQCVVCLKEGNAIEPCTHRGGSILKRFIWKFKHIFFVKETMRPFVLVMAYFFFHIMSGFAPVRSN
ncbi:Sugar transporter, partial [Operophtera brumata]